MLSDISVQEFIDGDKSLVRNQTRDVWDLKNGSASHVLFVMRRELKLADKSGRT